MAHIHTETGQHDHTASAFILRVDEEGPKLLLHNHKILKVLLQPGGHVDLHENVWQAVLHEIVEETGYELEQLQILQPEGYSFPELKESVLHPTPVLTSTHQFGKEKGKHYHTDTTYAFVSFEEPKNRPAEGESADLRWVGYTELSAFTADEIVPDVQTIGKAIFEHHYIFWKPIDLAEFETHL